jgi:ribosomal protein S6
MKAYEAFLVFAPEPTEEGKKKQVAEVDGLIEKAGGKITHKEDQGKKPLGYFRKKHREGNCFVYDVSLEPLKVVEVRKSLELNPGLIHYIWTLKPVIKPKKVSKKPAPAVKKEDSSPSKTTAGAK